jgi:hypothetical protein
MNNSILIGLFMSLPLFVAAQSNNYWTRSFNEESSLLSGAVVGGGSGPSAIYYNPASISEVVSSKFSLNASLFSFNFLNIYNALGDSIDIGIIDAKVEPRFISYMLKSKKHQNWSFEVAFLNNENEEVAFTASVDEKNNVLTGSPGADRYFAYYQYNSKFRDDWIGIGASARLSERIIVGLSMFAAIKTLNYTNSLDIQAYPLTDSIQPSGRNGSFYAATYEENKYLKFNDYRLLWKAGLLCKWESISVGLSITTPSVGVYSDGKRVERKEEQSNISNPETGEPIPDYLITDYEEKDKVDVSFKTPFSVSAGVTYLFPRRKMIFYLSMEYFSGIEPYRMAQADESPLMTVGSDEQLFSDWLTFVSGAKQIFNVAFGYSWTLSDKLLLKAGCRTDFNYQKNLDYGDEYADKSKLQKSNLDRYYLTCGLSWKIFGQDIITGVQYCIGRYANQKQVVNLTDPVEYNFTEHKALQGTRTSDMTTLYNSVIIYLGFSLNFGEKKKP